MSDIKTPAPPVPEKTKLHYSLNFWSSVLITLDKKLQSLNENRGFGKIGIVFEVKNGELIRIVWNDEVSDVSLVEKGSSRNQGDK